MKSLLYAVVSLSLGLALAACMSTGPSGQPMQDPQAAQAVHDTYCVAKALYCAAPNTGMSGDMVSTKMIYCSVNTICLPPPGTQVVSPAASSATK